MPHVLPSRAADASYGLFTVRTPPPTHDNSDMSCWARLGNPQCFLSSSSNFFSVCFQTFSPNAQRSTHKLTLPHVHPPHPRCCPSGHARNDGDGWIRCRKPWGFPSRFRLSHRTLLFLHTFLSHLVRFLCGWFFKRACTRARNYVRPPAGRLLTYTYVLPHLIVMHRSLQHSTFSGPTTAYP